MGSHSQGWRRGSSESSGGCLSYRLSFEMMTLPQMTNRRGSSHWRRIHSERLLVKSWVANILKTHQMPKAPLSHAKLTLTRYSSVSPDPDGLVSGFKSVIDALVECGVLENDRFTNIGMPDFRWEKAPRGKGKITVEVEAT